MANETNTMKAAPVSVVVSLLPYLKHRCHEIGHPDYVRDTPATVIDLQDFRRVNHNSRFNGGDAAA